MPQNCSNGSAGGSKCCAIKAAISGVIQAIVWAAIFGILVWIYVNHVPLIENKIWVTFVNKYVTKGDPLSDQLFIFHCVGFVLAIIWLIVSMDLLRAAPEFCKIILWSLITLTVCAADLAETCMVIYKLFPNQNSASRLNLYPASSASGFSDPAALMLMISFKFLLLWLCNFIHALVLLFLICTRPAYSTMNCNGKTVYYCNTKPYRNRLSCVRSDVDSSCRRPFFSCRSHPRRVRSHCACSERPCYFECGQRDSCAVKSCSATRIRCDKRRSACRRSSCCGKRCRQMSCRRRYCVSKRPCSRSDYDVRACRQSRLTNDPDCSELECACGRPKMRRCKRKKLRLRCDQDRDRRPCWSACASPDRCGRHRSMWRRFVCRSKCRPRRDMCADGDWCRYKKPTDANCNRRSPRSICFDDEECAPEPRCLTDGPTSHTDTPRCCFERPPSCFGRRSSSVIFSRPLVTDTCQQSRSLCDIAGSKEILPAAPACCESICPDARMKMLYSPAGSQWTAEPQSYCTRKALPPWCMLGQGLTPMPTPTNYCGRGSDSPQLCIPTPNNCSPNNRCTAVQNMLCATCWNKIINIPYAKNLQKNYCMYLNAVMCKICKCRVLNALQYEICLHKICQNNIMCALDGMSSCNGIYLNKILCDVCLEKLCRLLSGDDKPAACPMPCGQVVSLDQLLCCICRFVVLSSVYKYENTLDGECNINRLLCSPCHEKVFGEFCSARSCPATDNIQLDTLMCMQCRYNVWLALCAAVAKANGAFLKLDRALCQICACNLLGFSTLKPKRIVHRLHLDRILCSVCRYRTLCVLCEKPCGNAICDLCWCNLFGAYNSRCCKTKRPYCRKSSAWRVYLDKLLCERCRYQVLNVVCIGVQAALCVTCRAKGLKALGIPASCYENKRNVRWNILSRLSRKRISCPAAQISTCGSKKRIKIPRVSVRKSISCASVVPCAAGVSRAASCSCTTAGTLKQGCQPMTIPRDPNVAFVVLRALFSKDCRTNCNPSCRLPNYC